MIGDDRVVTTTANVEPQALVSSRWFIPPPGNPKRWLGSSSVKPREGTAYFIQVRRGHRTRVSRNEARALSVWNGKPSQ